MKFIETEIPGIFIIEPKVFEDERGYFYESFSQKEFEEHIGPVNFVQNNQSKSSYGVVRGLHYQKPPYAQAKLVRCTQGKLIDIAVDVRKDSPYFMKHVMVELSEDNHRQLYIPKGFAHGFVVLSETAILQYKCDNYYNKESDGGIYVLDEKLGLNIKDLIDIEPILSEKDKNQQLLNYNDLVFEYNNLNN